MKYIIFAGLFQAIVSIILLLSDRQKKESDAILIVLLIGISWHLITKFYIFTILNSSSVSVMMHTFVQLSYGPLLYVYIQKKNNKFYILSSHWYLFIPFIMSSALYASVIITYFWYPDNGEFMLSFYNIIVFPFVIGTHFIFGIYIIIKNKKIHSTDYVFIFILCLLLMGLGIAEILLVYAANKAPQYVLLVRGTIYTLLSIIPVLVIRQKFLNSTRKWEYNIKQYIPNYQVNRFSTEAVNLLNMPVSSMARKLLLEPVHHAEIFKKIELLIKNNQYYKEDISLEKLAIISGISRHYISETLNVFVKKSFYQYINECRVEEVIKELSNNIENASLLSIAYKAGFKNKSSFNAYFKKIIGSTPSEYIRAQEKSMIIR